MWLYIYIWIFKKWQLVGYERGIIRPHRSWLEEWSKKVAYSRRMFWSETTDLKQQKWVLYTVTDSTNSHHLVYHGLSGLSKKTIGTPPLHHFIYRFIIIFTGQNWGERAERWSGKSSDRLQRKRIMFDNPILTIMAKDDLWIKYRAMKN